MTEVFDSWMLARVSNEIFQVSHYTWEKRRQIKIIGRYVPSFDLQDALYLAVKDPSPLVRLPAIKALAVIACGSDALIVLREVLDREEDPSCRWAAMIALNRISQKFGNIL